VINMITKISAAATASTT